MPSLTHSTIRSRADLTDLKQKLDQYLASLLPETKTYAFWDFDGTLLRGDISIGKHSGDKDDYYGLVEEAVLQGLTPEYQGKEGLRQLWTDYERKMSENYSRSHAYLAGLIHRLTPEKKAALKNIAYGLMQPEAGGRFYPESMEIMEHLSSQGVRQCIISASPHLLVEIGAGYLPVQPEFALGVGCDDHLPEADRLINCGEGKAKRAEQIIKNESRSGPATPVFAAGNYWSSDGAMLEWVASQGGMSLLVNDKLPVQKPSDKKLRYYNLSFH